VWLGARLGREAHLLCLKSEEGKLKVGWHILRVRVCMCVTKSECTYVCVCVFTAVPVAERKKLKIWGGTA